MNRRPQIHDGEWVYPTKRYRLECCDCSLVHLIEFQVKGKFCFRIWRDRQATKRARALRKKILDKVV